MLAGEEVKTRRQGRNAADASKWPIVEAAAWQYRHLRRLCFRLPALGPASVVSNMPMRRRARLASNDLTIAMASLFVSTDHRKLADAARGRHRASIKYSLQISSRPAEAAPFAAHLLLRHAHRSTRKARRNKAPECGVISTERGKHTGLIGETTGRRPLAVADI